MVTHIRFRGSLVLTIFLIVFVALVPNQAEADSQGVMSCDLAPGLFDQNPETGDYNFSVTPSELYCVWCGDNGCPGIERSCADMMNDSFYPASLRSFFGSYSIDQNCNETFTPGPIISST